jgi:hypothetical protein
VAPNGREQLGPIRAFVAFVGASFIAGLIRVFGRVVRVSAEPWLAGPIGGDYIGDRPYEEVARREGLTLVRHAGEGGLLPSANALDGPSFHADELKPEIRRFYEHTTGYRMDVWSAAFFPGKIGLWLLVTTLSRKVNQLNFPLHALTAVRDIDSEIVLLKESAGPVRYAGWYRRIVSAGRALYAGFYMTQKVPHFENPCVKVVFPMPNGNATVVLRPSLDKDGNLRLSSKGTRFGDAGFYRVQKLDEDRLRVWRVKTLHEEFFVYLDSDQVLRCDHTVSFFHMRVLKLHYRIERVPIAALPA